MTALARRDGMIGVDFVGTRYDMGNKLGILQATCEVALQHPEVKDEFRNYLKNLAKNVIKSGANSKPLWEIPPERLLYVTPRPCAFPAGP